MPPWSRDDRAEIGGDLKTALSPNLTLDLTANTDFAEAEVDDQRVNLTRFPLFYPERRGFFVERAGTFTVRTSETDLLFNSLSVQRDRARQLTISQELDEIEAELGALRPMLAATGDRSNAASEQVAKSDGRTSAERGDALGVLLRTPSIKKAELPDPLELDNSMGVRSQVRIK